MMMMLYRLADALRGLRRKRVDSAEISTGKRGEDIAQRYLQRQGLIVVARNWRPRSSAGELDLVAWAGETLVFVEVKTRGTGEFGAPDRAVDREKRGHLWRAAREYARRAGVDPERIRFDIVSVTLAPPLSVEWIRDAFRVGQTL
jgi:putative endonuclease